MLGVFRTQKVPVSPVLETYCGDFLSLHPTPRKRLSDDQEGPGCSLASFSLSEPGNQCLEEECEDEVVNDIVSLKGHHHSLPISTCASWDDGISQEFKTTRAVPCFSMAHAGPSRGQLQLARVVSLTSSGATRVEYMSVLSIKGIVVIKLELFISCLWVVYGFFCLLSTDGQSTMHLTCVFPPVHKISSLVHTHPSKFVWDAYQNPPCTSVFMSGGDGCIW